MTWASRVVRNTLPSKIAAPRLMMPQQTMRGVSRRIFDLGLPDLLAGLGIDRHRGGVGGDVDHALVDDRLRFLASVVGETVVPHRNEVLDVVLVDLSQRAEPLQIIAHSVIENVRGVGRALDQLFAGLGTGPM